MGLAPYGQTDSQETKSFKEKIYSHLIDVREDGSFLLNQSYFNYATGFTMTKDNLWKDLFGLARRKQESELSQSYMNLALAIQEVTEEIMLKLAKTAKSITGSNYYLVLSGGVAFLNCVSNGKLST